MDTEEYEIMFKMENDYWWYRGLHELVESFIAKEKRKDLKILDAGCGTGRMVEILQKYGNVKGIDYSSEAITLAQKRGLANVFVGDLNDLSEHEQYDIVVSLDVLCNIDDDAGVLRKFHSALRKDGILILNLPAFNILRREHDIKVWSKRRYRKNETVKKLREIGFDIKRATYRLPLLFLIIVVQKVFRKIFNIKKETSDLNKISSFANSTLLAMHRMENHTILAGINMPFGSSLFIIAKKYKDIRRS